jgi:hypothetical protein
VCTCAGESEVSSNVKLLIGTATYWVLEGENLGRNLTQVRDSLWREPSSVGSQLWAQRKGGEVETWHGIDVGVLNPEQRMYVCVGVLH